MNKLEYFKQKVLSILDAQEDTNVKDFKKSFTYIVDVVAKGNFPVGTIREWKGKKYIKIAPGKWRPKYDSHSRGAKFAVAALKRKAEQCKTSQELLQLVLENRDRFNDKDGKPLAFVKELSDYVSGLNDKVEKEAAKQPKAKVSEQPEEADAVNDRNGNTESRNNILRAELKTVLKPFINKDIENNATKIIARISTEGTNKMGSGKAIQKSEKNGFTVDEHFEVAKKIIELYKQAQLVHTGKDEKIKDNPNIISIKRFVAETQLKSGKEADALITVKESKEAGHRIYSIELDEIKTASTRWQADTSEIPPNQGTATTEATSSIAQPEGKSSAIKQIRNKYESTQSITGNKKTVTLPNGTKIKCHYKLVEAESPTASHDENTYSPTPGFPSSQDGKTVNDRDYYNDKDAQESVRKIAAHFNSLAIESPPIVTKDGIVISGNNRTMSSKLAAKNGTDTAYMADLKEMIDEYGLKESDLADFKHPRLILEMDAEHEGDYTTEEFAQFNRDTKKTMSNVEKAVKVTKTLNEEKIQSIASQLSGYETMGELYVDAKGCQRFVAKLIDAGIIGDNEKAQYLKSDGTLNDTGKDFTETVLVGTILNENNIRKLDSAGGKRIRQKLVRAILPLVENKGTGKEYSFNKELNEAVDIAVNVAKNHEKYPDVETYLAQGTLFGESKPDEVTGKLAKLIHDEGEKAFAVRMKNLGAGLKHSADGEMDIFLGQVETKQTLMERFLAIQKSITGILTNLYTKELTIGSIVAEVLKNSV